MRGLAVALVAVLLGGCTVAPARKDRPMDELVAARKADDAARQQESMKFMSDCVVAIKHKIDAQIAAGGSGSVPTIDILVISGGGDWGAFGAGVLKGWGNVEGDMRRPIFDVVTGVSTGALIAPFAFLGDDASIETINRLYRNPRPDWAESRGLLFFWPSNPSFYSLPGLERDLREQVNRPLLERISAEGAKGRSVVVNTTNVDYGGMHAWDIVAETNKALASGDLDHITRILLASAGVPGIFPSRSIGDCLYVDGAITGNILYGGRTSEEHSLPALWQKAYPNSPIPRMRFWVIFNNQIRFPPQVTQQTWPDILGRATIMATQNATVNSMRHLFAQAEISRLKRNADVQVRIMAVPEDWIPPAPGAFNPKVMNDLADIGERMGADPSTWLTESP